MPTSRLKIIESRARIKEKEKDIFVEAVIWAAHKSERETQTKIERLKCVAPGSASVNAENYTSIYEKKEDSQGKADEGDEIEQEYLIYKMHDEESVHTTNAFAFHPTM